MKKWKEMFSTCDQYFCSAKCMNAWKARNPPRDAFARMGGGRFRNQSGGGGSAF